MKDDMADGQVGELVRWCQTEVNEYRIEVTKQ